MIVREQHPDRIHSGRPRSIGFHSGSMSSYIEIG
jgi:hypothetical protein